MSEQTSTGEALRPFLTALQGTPVPEAELIVAGRRIVSVLVAHGRSVILCGDHRWAGVWDLAALTDDEAVSFGLWVASKVRQL